MVREYQVLFYNIRRRDKYDKYSITHISSVLQVDMHHLYMQSFTWVQAGRQAGRYTGSQADRHVGRQINNQVDR